MKTRIKTHWKVICILIMLGTAIVGCSYLSSWTVYFNNTGTHAAHEIEVWALKPPYRSLSDTSPRPTFAVFPTTTCYGTVPPDATNYKISILGKVTTDIWLVDISVGDPGENFATYTIDSDETTIDIP
jgi:hypothetical protein